jgi:hypothetical protein
MDLNDARSSFMKTTLTLPASFRTSSIASRPDVSFLHAMITLAPVKFHINH